MKLALFAFINLLVFASAPALAKIQVLACEPEWKALADEIGGEKIISYSATTAFQDPHHIEARPSLIAKARQSDLLFCTGAELEIGWLPLLLRQSGNKRIQEGSPGYFMAADYVEMLEVPDKLDRSMGDIHASGNPHVHLDPRRLLVIAEALTDRLVSIDPEHAQTYQNRLSSFKTVWAAKIKKWEDLAKPLKGMHAIVHHKSFTYLLDWLGIEKIADLEPKPGLPPTSAHLARLLKITKEKQPDFTLIAAYQNAKGARWLRKKTGVRYIQLPYTVGGDNKSQSLISLFDQSLDLLLRASPEHHHH